MPRKHPTLLAGLLFAVGMAIVPHAYTANVTIPLSGTATGADIADLTVTPARADMNTTTVGTQSTASISISHTGNPDAAALTISSIAIAGEHRDEFNTDFSAQQSLTPDTATTVKITFSPTAQGQRNAYLQINHNGRNSPHIVMIHAQATPIPQSVLDAGASDINFGTTASNQAKAHDIQLKNSGTDTNSPAIVISNVVISGPDAAAFTADFGSQATINPQATLPLRVTLKSSITGTKKASLQIQHDGENTPTNISLTGKVGEVSTVNPTFATSTLTGVWFAQPTTLTLGPDGAIYVADRSGIIRRIEVTRNGANNYSTSWNGTTEIDLINKLPNHNDDGQPNGELKTRLITGLLAAGSAANPVLYVSSGDPREGAGPSGIDKNLDTNSGIISRLTLHAGQWSKTDIVRGLPRSEENHQSNGMQLSVDGKTLYISQGGHTNMGVPSHNFARLPEYAYSAAILAINLDQIGNSTYDLPTLDDDDRAGSNDNNDPFGGNNGNNMAILTANSPVTIYAPGFRNAYDLVVTKSGKMYTIDNGPNNGWGGAPAGNCSNTLDDGGFTYKDGLHYVTGQGYYGGHPNPARGNTSLTFNDNNPQHAVLVAANPIECTFKEPGAKDGALYLFNASTNGLAEYTADNFGGAMNGDLIAASFDKGIYRVQLNAAGDKLTGIDKLVATSGTPLDVIAQGNNDPFPGTIWVVDYADNNVYVFEPTDY